MDEPDSIPEGVADSSSRNDLLTSRPAILFIAFIFAAIAVISAIGFLYNLTINYPGTGRPVIAVDPLWMFGHVVRGLGLGILACRMWLYQSAIKRWRGPDGRTTEEFARAHAAAWKTGAIVLGVLLVYSTAYVLLVVVKI